MNTPMDTSIHTPAHMPLSSTPSVLRAPLGTPSHRLSSQAWGPLGTALPVTSCQGGWGEGKQGLQMASCGCPTVGTSRSPRSWKSRGGGAASLISRAPPARLRLPGPTAPLRFPTSPPPFTEGETEAQAGELGQRPEAGPPLCSPDALSLSGSHPTTGDGSLGPTSGIGKTEAREGRVCRWPCCEGVRSPFPTHGPGSRPLGEGHAGLGTTRLPSFPAHSRPPP